MVVGCWYQRRTPWLAVSIAIRAIRFCGEDTGDTMPPMLEEYATASRLALGQALFRAAGALSGKVGSAFTCAMGAGVGGHETALAATHTALFSCGMVVCGVQPSPQLAKLEAATPLGVCLSPGQEQREEACRAAEQQGQQVADLAAKLQLASVVAQLRS